MKAAWSTAHAEPIGHVNIRSNFGVMGLPSRLGKAQHANVSWINAGVSNGFLEGPCG